MTKIKSNIDNNKHDDGSGSPVNQIEQKLMDFYGNKNQDGDGLTESLYFNG